MKYLIVAIFLLMLVPLIANCKQEQSAKIYVVGRAEENAIVLRIAPGSPALWELGNKHGYIIERYTVFRDKLYLGNQERQLLTTQPLKPLPLPQWDTLSLNNTFAEIAAEAIYGETFELSTDFEQDVMQMYNKAKELESRFSFALFSADMSLEVSQASGLYIKDIKVRKNERYLYRVYSDIPQNLIRSDTGFVYLSLDDYAPLPEIREVKVEFSDHLATLSWSTRYAQSFYSAYWIERSEDGKVFKRTSDLPYVNTYPEDIPDPGISYKLDSLAENNKTYYFRVIGISPFGVTGPPSEVVKGQAIEALGAAPAIRKITLTIGQTNLLWEFPESKESAITGFEVERSAQHDRNFKLISSSLPTTSRTFSDTKPEGTNYYRIKALGKNGEKSFSFPVLYQLEDSIPPLQPTGLTGFIDTAGMVTLHWNNNHESDLNGYRVFRSHFKNSEYSQVTSTSIDSAVFCEKIPLKNLSNKIYYKVQAIDSRFNPSNFSAVVMLLKPDIVPPVAPVFKSWNAGVDKLLLSWIPSASRDVAYHNLKVRAVGTPSWIVTKKFNASEKSAYEYTGLQAGSYEFVIEATDSSDNITPSKPLQATITGSPAKPLQSIKVSVDRTDKKITLTWKNTQPGVQKILVYRAEGDKPVTLYKSVLGSSISFVDYQLSLSTTYRYYLKVVLQDGSESLFSEPVDVAF